MKNMKATRDRLIDCFLVVFPKLSRDEAPLATIDSTDGWDSTEHFMLMGVIEEEFGVSIPEEMIGEIVSFSGFEDYLKSQGAPV
jgi:acyl carrier protein